LFDGGCVVEVIEFGEYYWLFVVYGVVEQYVMMVWMLIV